MMALHPSLLYVCLFSFVIFAPPTAAKKVNYNLINGLRARFDVIFC